MRDAALAVSVVLAVFVASPLHLPLNNPNEGVRVFTAKSLVEDHTFAIDDAVRAWGYIDDKSARDGHVYSSKAPLVSMLGAAAYFVFHPFTGDLTRPTLTRLCRGFGDALPCLVLAFVLWRALRARTRDPVIADLVTVGTVLGTGALASMNVLSGHALALLGPAAALALVAPRGPRRATSAARTDVAATDAGATTNAARTDVAATDASATTTNAASTEVAAADAACTDVASADAQAADAADHNAQDRTLHYVAGLALSIAVGAEYPAVLACAPIFVLGVVVGGRRAALEMIAGAAPVMILVAAAHTAMWGAPWRTGYSFLENHEYQGVVAGGLFGIGAPHLDVLGTVLFSPSVGLFFFSPFLVAGLVYAVRKRSLTVLVACALMFLFIAGFRGWRGGWSVGPRYISEVAGLLALPTALAFDAMKKLARPTLAALVTLSVLHSGVAGMFFPHLPDLFRNPVYEMMLPIVARGFAPDSLPLLVGCGPVASAAILVVLLFAPVVVALVVDAKSALVPGAAAALAVIAAIVATSGSESGYAGRRALEARRMLDNWRPDDGDPILDRGLRSLVAVDRARFAWPRMLAEGCARSSSSVAGPLAKYDDDLERQAGAHLVVVPDRFALDLGGVRGAGPFFVTSSDVARNRTLPCTGSIFAILGPHDALPGPLRVLHELDRRDAGDGTVVVELERAP